MSIFWLLLLLLLSVSCGPSGDENAAVIKTNMGDITIAFYDDVPGHVTNFKKLAADGFYQGTSFHRVIPGFMIQGGDPNSKDEDRSNDGQGGPGYTQPPEFGHSHIEGAVAAARLPDQVNPKKESSGSQFFITVAPQPHLDAGGYTVFGYVIDGMDVVRKISTVRRDSRDNPLSKVEIEGVSLVNRDTK